MAHHCDICGLLCHCGGDIDDLVLDHTIEAWACEHCSQDDDDYCDDDYNEDHSK